MSGRTYKPDLFLEPGREPYVEKGEIPMEELTLSPNEGLFYHGDDPYTGVAAKYYVPHQLEERAYFKAGKRHGAFEKWYPDGILSYQAIYEQGKLHGILRSWWKNGNIRTECSFQEGVPHGKHKEWYKTGVLFKELNLVRGKEEGLQHGMAGEWKAL